MVVTEYGVADLRGKSDAECIKAMLNICDSRFQAALLKQAIQAGKLPAGYRIPAQFTSNTPERLLKVYERHRDILPRFPMGSDFTTIEKELLHALQAQQAFAYKTGWQCHKHNIRALYSKCNIRYRLHTFSKNNTG